MPTNSSGSTRTITPEAPMAEIIAAAAAAPALMKHLRIPPPNDDAQRPGRLGATHVSKGRCADPVRWRDWLGGLLLRFCVVPVLSHDATIAVIQHLRMIAWDVPDCQPAPTSGLAPGNVPRTDQFETRWAPVVAWGDAEDVVYLL